MPYYVNSAARWDNLTRDFKELVPAPEMRRRMSRVLRMGVATGMEALAKLPSDVRVDAIITATRLGCLADSERFLRNVVEGAENFCDPRAESPERIAPPLLNPTPFIQSTFNTVGAQIAMLTLNHCYNVTYAHGDNGLEAALVDAMIRLDQYGAEHVLVGLFDESTPTLERIKGRLMASGGLLGTYEHSESSGPKGEFGHRDGAGVDSEFRLYDEAHSTDEHALPNRDGAWFEGECTIPNRDGAWFFVVSARPLPCCLGEIEMLTTQNLAQWIGS